MKIIFFLSLCFFLCSCNILSKGIEKAISPTGKSNSLHVGLRTGGDNAVNETRLKSNQGEVESNKKTVIEGAENVNIGKYSNIIIIMAILVPVISILCFLIWLLKFFVKIYTLMSKCKNNTNSKKP